MKLETESIDDDEWLLRRVRHEQFRTDDVPLISPNAFEPRRGGATPDHDGISLYREACLPSPEAMLARVSPDKKATIGIVKIRVGFIRSLGLTVKPMLDPDIKGHVVIPELDSSSEGRKKFLEIKLRLAEEASKSVVRESRSST